MPTVQDLWAMRGWACPACYLKNHSDLKRCSRCGTGKRTKRASTSARCDSMAAELCKTLAGFKCSRCGRWGTGPSRMEGLEWSHRVKRKARSVRWDTDNADCLCHECHAYFETRPIEYAAFYASPARHNPADPVELEQRGNKMWDKDYGVVIVRLADALKAAR